MLFPIDARAMSLFRCSHLRQRRHRLGVGAPLMDRVLREVERAYPPAPGNFRAAAEDFTFASSNHSSVALCPNETRHT